MYINLCNYKNIYECEHVCAHTCIHLHACQGMSISACMGVSVRESVCTEMCAFSVDWRSASSPKGNYSVTDAISYQEENIEQSEIVLITVTGPLL